MGHGPSSSSIESVGPGVCRLLSKTFSLGEKLGSGTFGTVFLCRSAEDGLEYAVKVVELSGGDADGVKKETHMLSSLRHPNIAIFHGVYFEDSCAGLVMDLYRGGSVDAACKQHWESVGKIEISRVRALSKMMFQAVEWLHRNHVVHRDLKAANFLPDRAPLDDRAGRVVLGDFGTPCTLRPGQRLTLPQGSASHWAPEVWLRNYSFLVDSFALGVTVFGLIWQELPFKEDGDADADGEAAWIARLPVRKRGEPCALVKDFFLGVVRRAEESRFNIQDALLHDFLADVQAATDEEQPVGLPTLLQRRDTCGHCSDSQQPATAGSPISATSATSKTWTTVEDGQGFFWV